MRQRPKPSDVDYEYYRRQIQLSAEAIVDEYDEDDNLHEMVWESADSDQFVILNGYQIAAIQLSDQDPDHPDYCSSWNVYYDSPDEDETASYRDALMAMAYVCVYSDIYDAVQRRMEENDD